MDARVRNQALVEGRVDAITGLASSMLAAIGASGKKVRFMLYSDYGVFLYGNVALLVPPKLVETRPEFCQAFTDGLMEGLKFSLVHPAEAQQIFLDAVPELKMTATAPEFARLGMGVQRFSVMSVPDGKEHGLGWADYGRLNQMTDFVMQYQAAPGAKKPDIENLFTNRFIGPVTLTKEEWATAAKETEWVGKMLHSKV
jgi:ABC-type nitrate/sulfonate/bicarbonate transport system substrate-binding protein